MTIESMIEATRVAALYSQMQLDHRERVGA